LKFYLYKKTKNGTEEIREHDLLSLITKGSEIGDMTFEDVIEFLLTDLLTTGQSFLIKHRGVSGKLLGFYPLPSSDIEVIYVGGAAILEYRIVYTNETIKRENVIHFKIPNVLGKPQNYYSGFSPLTPAKGLLEQVKSADVSQSAMFRNGGAQGIMFPDGGGEFRDLKLEDLEAIKDAYKSSYAGENSRGKIAITNVPMKWINTAQSAVDMQLAQLQVINLRRICALFKIPSALLNDTEKSTFNNVQEAYKKLYIDAVIPNFNRIIYRLNLQIQNDEDFQKILGSDYKAYYFELDQSTIEVLQKDKAQMVDWMKRSEVFTDNEIREAVGYQTSTDELADLVWKSGTQKPSGIDLNTNDSNEESD